MDQFIKKIISEEIAKMYEETNILKTYPELKESVMKFNRLVDEKFDKIKKVYDKSFKYNITDLDNLEKDMSEISEYLKEFEELKDTFNGYSKESMSLSDDEQIEVDEMFNKVNKFFYVLTTVHGLLGETKKHFEQLTQSLKEINQGSSVPEDKNTFKIYIN